MLRHQTSPTETSAKSAAASAAPQVSDGASAAQLRVTPEELAEALAALDARRMQTAHDASDTISIGDALNELNIDVTHEEVAAEVEAARAAHAKRRNGRNQPFPRKANLPAQVITGMAGALCAITSIFAARTFSSHPSPLSPATVVQAPAPRRLTMDQILVNQRDKNGAVTIKTLAEVSDNQAVSVKSGDLIQATSVTLGDYTEASQSSNRHALWTVVKHNGAPYVHGFLSAPLSPGALRLGNVVITNEMTKPDGRKCGASPTPIAIRMDKIAGIVDNRDVQEADGAYRVSDGNWERITLPTVAPDAVYTPISKP